MKVQVMREAFCGIDVGTQGVRVAIVAEDGAHLGVGSASSRPAGRSGHTHEQDPRDWWRALADAVRAALADAGDGVRIEALALDATSGTVLVEDAAGEPYGPALMYDDARAGEYADRAQRAGAELWTALGYRVQPSWALPKVLWLLAHDAVPAGGHIVHQSDHLVRRLVGRPVATDTSNALKTGADLRTVRWPAAVFAELGVPDGLLPELVLPGAVLGEVSTEAARATGLRAGTPVRAGMTDGCAAQIASGALRPGSWSSALGTTLVIKGTTTELIGDPSGTVYSHRHPDGGWLPGGASNSGAGVLAAHFAGADLDELTERARALVPMPGVTYPLVGAGERFPFFAADARGFITEEASGDAGRFAALCQAVGYVERLAYDVLGTLGADVAGPVALTGGATRNRWWNRLRTDVLGRTTVRPASAEAATGMAVLAAAAPGELAGTARRMVRIDERLVPDPERGAELAAGYREFVAELADRGWLDAPLAGRVLADRGSADAGSAGRRDRDVASPVPGGDGAHLALVRHGETVWHADNRYAGGTSDVDLTERGVAQSHALAEWARGQRFDALVASPVRRAQETAGPVAQALGLVVETVADLREVDFGVAEGRTVDELLDLDAEMVHRFHADPVAHPFPGAESPEAAALRAAGALRSVARAHPGGRVLVVAHNTLLRLALCELLHLPVARYRQLFPRLDNGAITELVVSGVGGDVAALLSLNVRLDQSNPQV